MNYIFLDIDGVLNSKDFLLNLSERQKLAWVDPFNIELLAQLVHRSDSKVILSSSWRLGFDDNMKPIRKDGITQKLVDELNKHNIILFDKTIELNVNDDWARPYEIKHYIKKNLSKSDKFVILDDEDCGLRAMYGDNFIQTEFNNGGLKEEHIQQAYKLFNVKEN